MTRRPITRCIDCGEEMDTGPDGPLRCESCDPDDDEREARQVAQDAHDWAIDLALQRAPKEQ